MRLRLLTRLLAIALASSLPLSPWKLCNSAVLLQIVLVGVPGAFTPVCSSSHVPGFISSAKQFADKGVDYIGVLATNE